MQLQEEFSRLIYLYQEAVEGKSGTVQEIFNKSLEFINHLKEVMKTGDAEDRAAALRMMNELYEHMKNHTKAICEKTGVTEEKLEAELENPSNFTPEQWRKMQEDKEKLAKAGKDLVMLVERTEVKPMPVSDGPASIKAPASKKRASKGKHPKKTGWMRS